MCNTIHQNACLFYNIEGQSSKYLEMKSKNTILLHGVSCSVLYYLVLLFFFWCVQVTYYLLTIFVLLNRKYLEDPCVWVESNTTTLSILSSNAEIGLGFLLIISLFSSVAWAFSSCYYCDVFVSCNFGTCLFFFFHLSVQVATQHNTSIHVLAGKIHFYGNQFCVQSNPTPPKKI